MIALRKPLFATENKCMRNLFLIFLIVLFVQARSFAYDDDRFNGEAVCEGNPSKAALVVIDMQPGFVTRGGNDKEPANVKKVDEIITAQAEAIREAKSFNIPIVFIESVGGYGDTNSKLKDAVRNYSRVRYFVKTSDGMFDSYNKSRADLVAYIKENDVGTLIVTGANGGACVLRSIRGSLDGNCTVLAYSNGIADFNYKDFIYPYVGWYLDIKNKCTTCKFEETSSVDDIVGAMARGGGGTTRNSAPTSNHSNGAVR